MKALADAAERSEWERPLSAMTDLYAEKLSAVRALTEAVLTEDPDAYDAAQARIRATVDRGLFILRAELAPILERRVWITLSGKRY